MPLPKNRVDHVVWVVERSNLLDYVARAEKLFGADFEHLYGPDVTGLGIESYISWETGLDFIAVVNTGDKLSASMQEFLDTRGEGIWGITFGVADVKEAVDRAHELGFDEGSVNTTLSPEDRRARAQKWTKKVTDLQQVQIGSLAGSSIWLSQIDYAEGV